jgi:hypothetical protein
MKKETEYQIQKVDDHRKVKPKLQMKMEIQELMKDSRKDEMREEIDTEQTRMMNKMSPIEMTY